MDAFEQIGSQWPGIGERVVERLTADESTQRRTLCAMRYPRRRLEPSCSYARERHANAA
jgi:hypothetical protein